MVSIQFITKKIIHFYSKHAKVELPMVLSEELTCSWKCVDSYNKKEQKFTITGGKEVFFDSISHTDHKLVNLTALVCSAAQLIGCRLGSLAAN